MSQQVKKNFDQFLQIKRDRLFRALKILEHNASSKFYNHQELEDLVKPLNDLINSHIVLLDILQGNLKWLKYAEMICKGSLHCVAVPDNIYCDNFNFEKEVNLPITKYTGKSISINLHSLQEKLEPFVNETNLLR